MNAFTRTIAVASASLLLSGGIALAECADNTTTNSTASVKTPPISKDATKAPLQVEPNKDAAAGAQKNGRNMPLGENKDVATSQQDVVAQQQGDKTAAAKAEDEACKDKG